MYSNQIYLNSSVLAGIFCRYIDFYILLIFLLALNVQVNCTGLISYNYPGHSVASDNAGQVVIQIGKIQEYSMVAGKKLEIAV